MMHSSYKKQLSNLLTASMTDSAEHMGVYLLGSLRGASSRAFNRRLSDVDLLVVPDCDSLDCYVGHFEQLMNLSHSLTSERTVDFFFLPSRIVELHFSVLSVIAGTDALTRRDLIFGHHVIKEERRLLDERLLSELYRNHSIYFYEEYIRKAPFADTTKARLVAKRFLRAYKLLACADAEPLRQTERRLHKVYDFEGFSTIIQDFRFDPLFDLILKGENVEDWSHWMSVQSEAALQIERALPHRVGERSLFYSLCRIYTIIMIDLKNILSSTVSTKHMEDFVHEAVSACVAVALAGVARVADLSKESIKTKESFEIIEGFLKGDEVNLLTVAAASVLLEHSFLMGANEAEARLRDDLV